MWMLVFRLFAAKQCRASLIPGMKFSLAWFISGILFLAPMGYRPLRYYVPLLIPMFFAGGWWLDSIGQVFQHRKPAFYRLLFPVWMMIPVSMNLIVIGDLFFFDGRWLKVGRLPGFSIAGAFLTILTGVFILYAEYRPKRRILTGWVALLIFVDFFRLGDWMIHRTYYIRDASRDLAAILPESSVIAGQWAPQLVLETRHVAIPMWKDFVNDKDPLHTYHVTHVLSWQYAYGDELELQKRNFPELMDNADLIKSYQIKNSPVLLWEIRKKSAGSDPAL